MPSNILRPTFSAVARRAVAPSARLSRPAFTRSYAGEVPGDVSKSDTTRPVPTNPAGGSSRLPFIIGGGLLFAVVAGRYFIASSKSPASGNAEQLAAKRRGEQTGRDARDSPVKTLEQQKQQKENS